MTDLTTEAGVLAWAQQAGETAYQGVRQDSHFEQEDIATAKRIAENERLRQAFEIITRRVSPG